MVERVEPTIADLQKRLLEAETGRLAALKKVDELREEVSELRFELAEDATFANVL